jgi:ribonuclease R
MTSDAQAEAGTPEGQGPVEISPELADKLEAKREKLFEKFEIRDEFPQEVLTEAEKRTEGIQQEIEDEIRRTSTTRFPSRSARTSTFSGSTSPT